MGTSKTAPNSWMTKDGTGKTVPYATPRGWCITHPNGVEEVLCCMTGCVEAVARTGVSGAGIMLVKNPVVGNYALGSNIDFKVTWDEPVNITVAGGIPRIPIKVGKRATLAPVIGTGADAGKLMSVTVTDGGSGYAALAAVTIAGAGALGTARVATVGPGGVILTIEVTAQGSGYVQATTTATVADTAVTKYASLIGGAKTGATKSTFRFVADATLGEVNDVTTSISLNGGTILSDDDNVTAATLTFPADYDQAAGALVI